MEASVSVDQEIAAWRLACERGVPFGFRGLGTSMWPALRPGDEALFEPIAQAPRVGDVLLFRAGDRLIAHRLLAVAADGMLRLRGDFVGAEDPPVAPSAVLGRLMGVRRGGRVLDVAHGRLAIYAAVVPGLAARAPRLLAVLRLAARAAARLTDRRARG
jgi:signal peptidase